MSAHKTMKGSTIVEYLVIAGVFSLLFFSIPQIRQLLEDHHDQSVETLSIPR